MTDKPNPTYGQSRLLRLELTSSHRPSTAEEQVGAKQLRNRKENNSYGKVGTEQLRKRKEKNS
jgi:hypothetical protein